jgi:hypothetical protein
LDRLALKVEDFEPPRRATARPDRVFDFPFAFPFALFLPFPAVVFFVFGVA